MIRHAIARGNVWHRRHQPFDHHFSYPLWLVWCDISDISPLLSRHWLWGDRWRPVVFRHQDFVDGSDRPLDEKVREKAKLQGLDWHHGRVIMLGQWRTLGSLFNPLVLYLHFADGEDLPDSLLAEVQNTPWKQRHFYAVPLCSQRDGSLQADHSKEFHVSPFLPMALRYHWRLHVALPELRIVLEDRDNEQPVFTAGLQLSLQELTPATMNRVIWQFGARGLATLRGIYWQAWRLWRKGAVFHSHPDKQKASSRKR